MKFQKEEQLLNQLKKLVEEKPSSRIFAALDADGTLWPEDANYNFLKYEMETGLRDLKDLLSFHYGMEGHRYKRCQLLAERQAGFELEELQMHCRKALQIHPLHVFPFQRELLAYLKDKGMKIVILTASLKWLVEQAVQLYDLPVDEVLGVETRLKGGKISSELVQPAPFAGSKGEVFLKYSQGGKCFLAGGNTPTDLPLLEMAEAPFAVHSAGPDNEIFPAEQKLKKQAVKNNWIVFEKM